MTRTEAVEHNARVLTSVPWGEVARHLVPAPPLPRMEKEDR